MTEYTLTYFDGEGLGESIRLLLHYGKIEFVDKRIDYENEWADIKDSFPWGQLPTLEIDGKVLHQSVAIGRYLAKEVGLYSEDSMEAYEIDSAIDTINDFKAKLSDAHYETDEEIKEKKFESLQAETIPNFLKKLENLARENHGHLALNKFTWADVYLTGVLTYVKSMLKMDDLGAKYPNLRQVVKIVKSKPGIKEWIENKPQSEW